MTAIHSVHTPACTWYALKADPVVQPVFAPRACRFTSVALECAAVEGATPHGTTEAGAKCRDAVGADPVGATRKAHPAAPPRTGRVFQEAS
eukprot:CAMPEP_0195574070 /NCGR_PEP_ID=MMETSP0814-20130614/5734_1 /TAXON_ID=97485 /ORGANISM="Prymnesium parvum, Strain Texoma1" /LENGTH=90 /DNA_ID=CAMNT_0040710023 /DNA_START=390 /DNA_END=663 /DNA_ORIENTATION=-